MNENLPTYDRLLLRTDAPPGSSWGLFPEDPERGMANFAGPRQVLRGTEAIRTGAAFSLDYPADAFEPSMSRNRKPPAQTVTSAHPDSFDDVWDGYWPQASSHIDGLRHRRAHGHGFYNGIPDARIAAGTPELGIQRWAEKPIVGRAVLADVERHRRDAGSPIDHQAGEPIGLGDITSALAAQGSPLEPGDMLLLHTGWAEWFLRLDPEGRAAAKAERRTTGIAQSKEFLAWLWDSRVALLGTDTFAVEALPASPESPFHASAGKDDGGMMHQELIAKLGCPLGELWHLNGLARECGRTGRYEVFLTVKPLNLPGAVGSPANATAIV
ncbi:cyclase family protein [Sinomonas terrae]|uniref:Cyclase family protein n=1 Tax=Sinomonas terrae TaxID=2908838 RepID=A0ABS9TWL4_9MICC|nr:cyclase family protein [Sinomonas terrae]MCH6468662.1 cyclase family protein [Sinomonas terrae]